MMRRSRAVLWFLVVAGRALRAACGTRGATHRRTGRRRRSRRRAEPLPPVSDVSAPRVVVLGDSLTAGLGLSMKRRLSHVLQDRIKDAGLSYTIVNAGVSGDTSAGGVSRLDWALDGDVRVLIVALGGNDGLRGLAGGRADPQSVARSSSGRRRGGISVVLAGMEAPPNYGFDYIAGFHKVYPALAKKYGVPLVPFLLQGVGGITALNQPDGIHPTAEGARMVADNVWTVLKPVLEADSRRAGAGRAPGR